MEVIVLGFYQKNNLGDESYKDTFPRLFPNHKFHFTESLNQNLVENCDVVLLGGGNVLRSSFIEQLKNIKNKKIYGFSVGFEEPPTENLSFFSHIYARDERTISILKELKIPCSFIPDAAFILQPNPQHGLNLIKEFFHSERCNLYSNIITVIVNGYILSGGLNCLGRDAFNFIKFSYDFARVIDETSASFVFIPFGTQIPFDDRTANAWVASKCKYWSKNCVVYDRINYQNALDIISASNLVISSRLHSSIFSFISGTQFIDITHHSKNELFLKMVKKEENSVSFWNFDSRILKEKIEKMIHLPKHTEYEPYRKMLLEKINEIHFG